MDGLVNKQTSVVCTRPSKSASWISAVRGYSRCRTQHTAAAAGCGTPARKERLALTTTTMDQPDMRGSKPQDTLSVGSFLHLRTWVRAPFSGRCLPHRGARGFSPCRRIQPPLACGPVAKYPV